jgi:hypothetical protein
MQQTGATQLQKPHPSSRNIKAGPVIATANPRQEKKHQRWGKKIIITKSLSIGKISPGNNI